MNRIYILGEVLSVSKVHFDYYNKLKAYFKFSILDMYGNVFECMVFDKKISNIEFQKAYEYILSSKKIFVVCKSEDKKYIVEEIY